MKRVIAALALPAALVVLLPVAPALAQTGATTPQTLPPSSSPSTVGPQSPSGTPSPFLTPQPFGTTSPTDPATGLPTNLPSSTLGTRSTSPSLGGPSTTTLPPPVWSAPSPPAGQPLSPGSR